MIIENRMRYAITIAFSGILTMMAGCHSPASASGDGKPDAVSKPLGLIDAAKMAGMAAIHRATVNVRADRDYTGSVEFGGYGTGQGKFDAMGNIVFGPKGSPFADTLYVLDGGKLARTGTPGNFTYAKEGNYLVQTFSSNGTFKSQFSIADDSLDNKNEPARIAVDPSGNVYVTEPSANLVEKYDPQGSRVASIAVPNAYAITWMPKSGILVLPRTTHVAKGAADPGTTLYRIDPSSNAVSTSTLSLGLRDVTDMTPAPDGTLYVAAAVNSLYQFSAAGALLDSIGSNTQARSTDGSEPHNTVAIDSAGNIYSTTWGNPGYVLRYSADKKTVFRRADSFHYGNPWITAGGYAPLAVDSHDGLWIGTTQLHGTGPTASRYHFSPAILRAPDNYFAPGATNLRMAATASFGLLPAPTVDLPYNIAYSFDPIPVHLMFPANRRHVDQVSVDWQARKADGTPVDSGTFDVALKDGEAATGSAVFTPKEYGPYDVGFHVYQKGATRTDLGAVAIHIGVTPRFPNLPVLAAGESPGGWDDAPRLAFVGHRLFRTRADNLDSLEKAVAAGEKYNLIVVGQFDKAHDVTDDKITAAVTRFKGRVHYWSILNEPDISLSAVGGYKGKIATYVTILRHVAPIIRSIDPAAKILAPSFVCMDKVRAETFYGALGPGETSLFDIFSTHDYQGNESIDPAYWKATLKDVRDVMEQHGDGKKEIWQLERAITAVRGNTYDGMVQAVRVMLHRNVLDTQGIPGEHDNHYYLNEGGYSSVPSFLWSAAGPHPAALALRTRTAVLGTRHFVEALSFGPSGDLLVMGLRHRGDDGSQVITLQSLGAEHLTLAFSVKGTTSLSVSDGWGNVHSVPVSGGVVSLEVGLMPIYVTLSSGQDLTPPRLDYGPDLAAGVTPVWSGMADDTSSPIAAVTDGVLETLQTDAPTTGKPWRGFLTSAAPTASADELEKPASETAPPHLDIPLKSVQKVNRVAIFASRADNASSALLDYDLQYRSNGKWLPLQSVRTAIPASVVEAGPLSLVSMFYADQNTYLHSFPTVETDCIRLVVRRTTYGYLEDETAVQQGWHATSASGWRQLLVMREFMVFGPTP